MTLSEGAAAPNFTLNDEQSAGADLRSLKGTPVVLYFYPKDDTPGCTAQAKDFSCMIEDFTKAGAQVIGISPDNEASHERFRSKHDLRVRLAADEDHKVAETYGVWTEKKMYGRKFMGVERTTFLIGPDGKIVRIWPKVKVPGHAEEVLAAVRQLNV